VILLRQRQEGADNDQVIHHHMGPEHRTAVSLSSSSLPEQ
jgi:hypothetical protein